ncbi:DUF397 domain-containing protein [Micromonospora sp. NBC_01699]|uniref:DUF397 domain-containing protein n=1 Tax=Micromonospora sp. NBC_01699 TaxID=2975984 RepID=UPI002E27D4B5|nr:DUF397 domain-containing protein [Micromonospora sp. NBC_01699]
MTGTQLGGAIWRRSSRSGSNANCVEMAYLGTAGATPVGVRDSKDVDGPVLAFAATAWTSFVAAARRHRLG